MITTTSKQKHLLNRFRIFFLMFLFFAGISCEKLWEEHYQVDEQTVDEAMWEHIKSEGKYSVFISYMEEYGLDTLFGGGGSYTLFIPTDAAFSDFNADNGDIGIMLKYHMLDYLFGMINVEGSKLLQTYTGKFAQTEYYEGNYYYSGVRIAYTSPLYLDGRYYELEEIAYPLPNLYELIALDTKVLKSFIDSYDSILLDLGESKPQGFDDDGNVIYDSVYTVVNYFDSLYFPVNTESRSSSATFLLFTDDQYFEALDEMALELGTDMTGADIPQVWQDEVLIPELVETGLFPNTLQYDAFLAEGGKMKNVKGDSVQVDLDNIDPGTRQLCSNGAAFSYYDFKVPEYLYRGEVRIEGEHMVDSLGAGIYFWRPDYKVSGTTSAVSANPTVNVSVGASNDSLVSLTFPDQPFNGQFQFEFSFRNMFPQKYLFVWGANYRPSGIYRIYANDVLIKEYDTFTMRQTVYSVDGESFYFPDAKGNNKLDAWIDHLTEYGDVKITIEYAGVGGLTQLVPVNGFNIDFISLTPSE